jgi:hypothetical protein
VDDDHDYSPSKAVDLDNQRFFISGVNQPGQWLSYDFKKMRVTPTHYSIKTHKGPSYPKNWVIEGSEDGKSWIELGRRKDKRDLNGKLVTKTFPVARSEEVRFIRFLQTGKTHENDDCLYICAFEVFGFLKE